MSNINMAKPQIILSTVLGIFMVSGGILHFINPEMYNPFIPDFLPKKLTNYLSGIVEIVLGVGLFIPRYKSNAAFGIFLLMIAFLPIHIVDVFKDSPAIGSKLAALIRLPLQFILIFWAWHIKKNSIQNK